MKGLTISSIRQHTALVPLYACVGLGFVVCGGYILRSIFKNPDVSIDRKNNPYPWQRIAHNEQYKFLAVTQDYKNLPKPNRPDY